MTATPKINEKTATGPQAKRHATRYVVPAPTAFDVGEIPDTLVLKCHACSGRGVNTYPIDESWRPVLGELRAVGEELDTYGRSRTLSGTQRRQEAYQRARKIAPEAAKRNIPRDIIGWCLRVGRAHVYNILSGKTGGSE